MALNAPSPLSSLDEITEALANGAGARAQLKTGLAVGNSAKLTAQGDGSAGLEKNGVSFLFDAGKMSFYRQNGIDFAVMSDTAPGASTTAAVWAGKLDYAVFGYWVTATENSDGSVTRNDGGTFYYGGPSTNTGPEYAKAKFDNKDSAYKGIASGTFAYTDSASPENNTVIPVAGTAQMILTAHGSNGTLTLDFPGFYIFRMTATASPDGSIAGAGSAPSSITKSNSYAYPASLPGSFDSGSFSMRAEGQFFGPSENQPTETAGKWKLQGTSDGGSKIYDIQGVFGMKR